MLRRPLRSLLVPVSIRAKVALGTAALSLVLVALVTVLLLEGAILGSGRADDVGDRPAVAPRDDPRRRLARCAVELASS